MVRSGVSGAKPSLCVATGTKEGGGAVRAIGWGEVVAAVRVQLAEANVSQRLAMLINSADLQLFHWQRQMPTENPQADILVTLKRIPGSGFPWRTPPPYMAVFSYIWEHLAPLSQVLSALFFFFFCPTDPTKNMRARPAGPASLAVVPTVCACVMTNDASTLPGKCSS